MLNVAMNQLHILTTAVAVATAAVMTAATATKLWSMLLLYWASNDKLATVYLL